GCCRCEHPFTRPARSSSLLLGLSSWCGYFLSKPRSPMLQARTRRKPLSCSLFGAVAQLGEHLVCNQGVVGSNPIRSTASFICGAPLVAGRIRRANGQPDLAGPVVGEPG